MAGPAAVALVAAELQQNQSNLAKWTSELDVYEKKRAQLVNLLKEALNTQVYCCLSSPWVNTPGP